MIYQSVEVSRPGVLNFIQREKPKVQSNDCLARITHAGICGTDIHLLHTENPFPWKKQQYPFRLGHEWSGIIEEMAQDFLKIDGNGLAIDIGDRIVAYPSTWACGKCYACRILLQPNLCMRPKTNRPTLPQDMNAFANWFYIPQDSVVFKVHDDLPNSIAVLTEPLAVALRAFERSFIPGVPDRFQGMGPGKSVVVLGSGTIGVMIAHLAVSLGCSPVMVIGGPSFRLDLCSKLGVDHILDIATSNFDSRFEEVMEKTNYGLGADVVFEAAGAPKAFLEGLRLCRPGGTLVEVGHYTDHGTIEINPLDFCRKDIHLFGSWGYGPSQFGEALKLLYKDKNIYERMVTHQFPFAEIEMAFHAAKQQSCLKVILNME